MQNKRGNLFILSIVVAVNAVSIWLMCRWAASQDPPPSMASFVTCVAFPVFATTFVGGVLALFVDVPIFSLLIFCGSFTASTGAITIGLAWSEYNHWKEFGVFDIWLIPILVIMLLLTIGGGFATRAACRELKR